jgi:predicted transcriptional regulator
MAEKEYTPGLTREAKTRLDEALAERLTIFAEEHYRSEAAVLRLALRFYLDAEEKPV